MINTSLNIIRISSPVFCANCEADVDTSDLIEQVLECRIQFQDVLVIQMLAGCTSGVSSALIG